MFIFIMDYIKYCNKNYIIFFCEEKKKKVKGKKKDL